MIVKNVYKQIIEFLILYIIIFISETEPYINNRQNTNHIYNKEVTQRCSLNNNNNRKIINKKHLFVKKINSISSSLNKNNNIKQEKENDVIPNKKLKKKDKKILKKYKDLLDIIPNKTTEYDIIDALEKIKTLAVHKFVESIDIYLSFNPKKSKMTKNDNIKTFITFPHNLKKKREKKIYVVTNNNLHNTAVSAGADVVGEDDLINKIKEREIKLQKKNNNFLLCTNDVIHKLTRVGKEIGSKGLMPNERSGTLVSEFLLSKHIKLFKFENTYIFKLNKLNTLNLNVGDVYMSNDQIKENILHLFDHLDNLEFFHFNIKNLKSIYLSSTMGFPFKIKKTNL
ncbi:hypothetical protein YYC_03941 [Plasmodium yoelii 17X]|uniref:50S ribosomal protein L1 n=4 Tax=Plasmodium yoelii TaxID=5861 RepID=A0AAF0B0Z8_PLAYO|nr:uncharacterized protein PY17X_0610900 [Plasmodium yoelii]EAA15202.1 L1P family of ribosomal proteins, putative [Plasmodium yoelii yoelii]ETB58309.1 hypothetical protein YYC_03941 [Plasmodium yoelii 17X]WBY55978.1 50S ribosomal protein L1 [Plasmodium yoelii yoelii]CDU16963.1 50S ribosomal protein L1, apicoplast, putative [Plasmodium yoelii]VTZ75300.1 50S ribosomal protein L1, apicoplast, putative [Plasmodium yoelii]|eukprot:XP_723637.1 uncharacterized protein PY17X_0610900 [Plasmodium yoelii]